MSLKLRISLLVSALLALAIGAITGFLLWNEQRALADEFNTSQIAKAEGLAEVCRDATVNHQFLPLANYLKKFKASQEVEEAMCLDPSGTVLSHTDLALTDTHLEDAHARIAMTKTEKGLETQGDVLEAWAPVLLGNERLGTARVIFSRRILEARLHASLAKARRRILQVSLPALLAGFAGAFLLTAWALKNFGTLVDGVRALGQGRLDHRIPSNGRDEVAWLAGEVNRMAEKLGELDRMKQDFVSAVTHDLKSPLSSIKIAADVAQEESESLLSGRRPSDRMADAYLHIRESQERLAHLITSLLDVAHIESALTLDKRPVNLEEVADRVVRAFELIARRKNLALTLAMETAVPPVEADEAKVERALSNLVSNAVKFTEAGSVTVRLSAEGGRALVRVEDTGPGIPPETREKLFSKFYRGARAGTAGKAEGTGLGLSIVKGFVEAHGGTVGVESAPGKGTTFFVTLPCPPTKAGEGRP